MKIEKIRLQATDSDGSALALSLLFHRVADELCEMAGTCKDVENALGDVIGNPQKPIDQPIIALQGLDRLRQSLEDLTRLSSFLAHTKSCPTQTIPVQGIRDNIVLAGLAERLTRSEFSRNTDAQTEHDEIWT